MSRIINIETPEVPLHERTFRAMAKIPRMFREMVITEKIDGTNASIHIDNYGNIRAACRNRWLSPGKSTDNYGFADWVEKNTEVLMQLGPGSHFGEWWGEGIQRRYGLTEKRFSLFNTGRWEGRIPPALENVVSIVPILFRGHFDTETILAVKANLTVFGSKAALGFMQPEGVVIYHKASGQVFKSLIENDEKAKGEVDGN